MPHSWLILSHHHPEDSHRCAQIGGITLCRRCLATWPMTFAVIAASFAAGAPAATEKELIFLLGPPLGEYLATHVGRLPYRPGRTWLSGLLAGVAMGRLFHRYLLDPADRTTWFILFLAGVPALLGALYATYQRDEPPEPPPL
jgi:hypothetical protein